MNDSLEVAIVGAGPAGIGTAVALERLDVDYGVLERDRIGASFRNWPDEMRLLTPSFPANAFGVRGLNADDDRHLARAVAGLRTPHERAVRRVPRGGRRVPRTPRRDGRRRRVGRPSAGRRN
ncbi:NAD(P)-binding domain-containing protein [Natronococcus roseus]